MTWLEPRQPIGDGGRLENELQREMSSTHPVHNVAVKAVARRYDCDEVLFEILDGSGRLAVVHLTWSASGESQPNWPKIRVVPDWRTFVDEVMARDNADRA